VKVYDKPYFDRFYRHPTDRVSTKTGLERKVRLAVGVAEFLMARPVRTVLDIGCGEAPWHSVLRRMRPEVRYLGIDSSEYVVERFGATRNIKRGDVAHLDRLRLPRRVDLVVCADVLQYVDTKTVERALRGIRRVLGGVAYIEMFVTEDEMEGDRDGWQERSAAEYRRMLRRVGLTQCGPYCFVNTSDLDMLNALEHC
jgi:SAM-dependent methyltransferase